MSASILNARNLSKVVDSAEGALTILDDLTLELKRGDSLAIVGRSGSGKSTLLGLLAGLDQPSSGEVQLAGHALSRLDEDQRADELEFNAKQAQRSLIMGHKDLSKHAVGADLNHLEQALHTGLKKQLAVPKVISVPKASAALPALSAEDLVDDEDNTKGKKRALEESEGAAKTPSKHSGGKDWKSDKKKDKSAKKSKRDSV